MTKSSNKQDENPNLEDWGINKDFLNGPITPAHRILYAKLHRMISSQYEDPYEKGPQKMARYFDSFLEFFRQEYPQDKNSKGSLKSLIPKKIQNCPSRRYHHLGRIQYGESTVFL